MQIWAGDLVSNSSARVLEAFDRQAYQQRSLWGDARRRFARNRNSILGLTIVVAFVLIALLAPLIAPYDPQAMQLSNIFLPPDAEHLFGTDKLGRDVLSRIMFGGRYDLGLTLISVAVTVLLGLFTGTMAAYFGGMLDNILMRCVDILLAFPAFVLALALVTFLGPSIFNLVLVLALTRFPRYARLIRGSVLGVKEREYIEAARMMGASDARIIARHILPNSIAPVIVYASLDLGSVITSLAGLSFLGVGIQPPTPDWGLMLTDARNNLYIAPWTAIFPGLVISLIVVGFNLMGDGLRDALDPRLRS
jgi:peptide/nickel transport system permease protein